MQVDVRKSSELGLKSSGRHNWYSLLQIGRLQIQHWLNQSWDLAKESSHLKSANIVLDLLSPPSSSQQIFMSKIVILDDVVQIRNSLAIRLKAEGHDVRTAPNGAEAIDLAYLFKPDLLITDWDLKSDYDGLEVAEAFMAANEHVKSIIISGHEDFFEAFGQVPDNDIGEKYGLVASLSKPFSLQLLVRTVRKALTDESQQFCS